MEPMAYLRYSESFKLKVIQEIESGKMTVNGAHLRYGIGSTDTIRRWAKKYGKNHLLGKEIRVETREEKDRLRELGKDKQRLESALAQSQLKVMALEKLIEIAEKHYKVDIKKNSGLIP